MTAEFAPCGVPLIGTNCQKSAMQREIESLRSSLTRVEEERDEAVNACDTRFDDGYQMAIEHCIRVCALVNEGLAGSEEHRESKRLINAIIARIGLRAPDPTRLSRASGKPSGVDEV